MKKRAIVTGANGFIGRAVTCELLKEDYTVYAVVRNGKEHLVPEDNRCIPIVCSLDQILELKEKIPSNDFPLFFHFAWEGSAGASRSDAKLQLQNVQWTIDALTVAKEIGCERFIVAGSIMEHETFAAAYSDGNKPGLGYIYGSGKLVAHTMCMSIAANLGIDILWAEITNAYGVGECSPRLINSTIKKCIRKESPQFTAGTQHYDFVYIDDVARAFRLIGEKGKAFHEYIIGSGQAKPLRDFLLEMKRAIAPDLDFIFGDVPFTGIDMPLEVFDTSKTERDTTFKAKVSFSEGCKKTFDWWKKVLSEGE